MPSKKNISDLAELKDKIFKSKSVVLSDYRGLTVKQFSELRNLIKAAGGELKVSKNTLLKLALKNKTNLINPTAAVFSLKDEISPIKALYEFSQKNELPEIKFGFFDGKEITKEEVISLAKLPGIDILRAQLVSRLSSPIYGLVYCLKANLNKLVCVLSEIKNNK